MPAGRPTNYDQETIDKAWSYVDQYSEYGHAFPSVVGLCKVIQRSRTTVYDWAGQKNNEFSYILEAINENQELVAWNKGLTGEYNANLTKLLLGKHGYHERQEVEQKNLNIDLGQLSDEELEKIVNNSD